MYEKYYIISDKKNIIINIIDIKSIIIKQNYSNFFSFLSTNFIVWIHMADLKQNENYSEKNIF